MPPGAEIDDLLRAYLAREHPPCPECGYDLHAITTDVCPECGARLRLTLASIVTVGSEPPPRGWSVPIAGGVLSAALVVLLIEAIALLLFGVQAGQPVFIVIALIGGGFVARSLGDINRRRRHLEGLSSVHRKNEALSMVFIAAICLVLLLFAAVVSLG